VAGVITPSTFCEFYLQPVYRAASARFQQVLFFSAHFPGRYFERPSFFLAYASQHLPMLRLRARFKPFDAEPRAWLNRWRCPTAGVLGQADLILPSLLPSFTFYFIRRRFHHVRASRLLLQPSLEVLLSMSNS
jgi:pimeloyl-ACP methyl ester carboxylesterase